MEEIDLKLQALKLKEACIESTDKKISEIKQIIELIDFYGDDLDDIDEAITKVRDQLAAIIEEFTSVITTNETSNNLQSNSVPDSATVISSLDRISIFARIYLHNRLRVYDKAMVLRGCFKDDLGNVETYIKKAHAQLQEKSSLPVVALSDINVLLSEISLVKFRLDSARQIGLLIVKNTNKAESKQIIRRSLSNMEIRMKDVESRLHERKALVTDAVRGLELFLTSHRNVRQWIENRNSYLSLDTEIIHLQDVKEKLSDLKRFNSTKIDEHIIKNMRKKLNKISEVCSIGSAADMMDNIERDDRSSDCRSRTQLVMLTELVKEWEQCEKKIKELATRFYKPNFKKMTLKYQLKTSEKMKLDLSVQKTKVLKALEELQFHLCSPIDSQHRIAAGEQIVQGELKTFLCQDGERYQLVLVCVKEDQHQGLQSLKDSEADHQLKLADNQSVDVEEKETEGTKTD